MSNGFWCRPLRLPHFSATWPGQDCALCGAPSGDAMFCAACEASLPAIRHACLRCALPLARPGLFCGRCLAKPHAGVDDSIAAFEYRFPLDRLVQRFKFAADLAVGRALASRLAACVDRADRPRCIVVPPLSPPRLRQRGFNQALELAKIVARRLAVGCEPRAIVRVRETEAQHELDRARRLANLEGAFACTRRFDGAHVAIVDDVVTTGATVETLARTLKEAGAGRVSAWAVARTPDPALG